MTLKSKIISIYDEINYVFYLKFLSFLFNLVKNNKLKMNIKMFYGE